MLLILILFILIILLMVEFFRYNKIKANAFSRQEVIRAADEEARKIRYKDPEITCEYCGAKVNTAVDRCCQHCGAPYDTNQEWLLRHSVKDSFVDEGTDAVISKREKKARVEAEIILGRIKKEILALITVFAIILSMSALGYYLIDSSQYKRNESVNNDSYHNYIETDYKIKGDGIIYDKDGVTITVTGIYVDEKYDPSTSYDENAKIGIHLVNKLGKNFSLVLKCGGINGIYQQKRYIYSYDSFRKNADITYYEKLSIPAGTKISEMIFDEIEVSAKDYTYTGYLDAPVTIYTTADSRNTIDLSDKKQLFSNDEVDIFGCYDDDKYSYGYILFIKNKSDTTYLLNNSELRINGQTIDSLSNSFRNELLPVGYTFKSDHIKSYKIKQEEMIGQKVEFALSFIDKENHIKDFSTGFIDISDLAS